MDRSHRRALFLSVLLISGLCGADGMTVYTVGTMEVLNGTDARLKCTFKSTKPVGERASVNWSFQPQGGKSEESVFYYHGESYPPDTGRFRGRAVWSGDLPRNDGSITVRSLLFADNGTFYCDVKNPPDVSGTRGEITVSVVNKVTYSEMWILAVAVGGATALVVLLVIIVVTVQLCRKKRQEEENILYIQSQPHPLELDKLNTDPMFPTEAAATEPLS
uniref:Myelin protein zero-like protein 2 n=1 Tax=Callorhinchus milii TaxID=7868 RepID=V9L3H2_CALMI